LKDAHLIKINEQYKVRSSLIEKMKFERLKNFLCERKKGGRNKGRRREGLK